MATEPLAWCDCGQAVVAGATSKCADCRAAHRDATGGLGYDEAAVLDHAAQLPEKLQHYLDEAQPQ